MDIEKLPESLSELIYKDVLGMLGEGEKQKLFQLCEQYGIKRTNYAEIIACLEKAEEFPFHNAYQQFKMRTQKKRRTFSLIWKAAAVLLILLGSTWLHYRNFHSANNGVPVVVEQIIKPGSSKAVITLASGERIELEKMSRHVQEVDGTCVQITGEELIYDRSVEKRAELFYNTIDIPRGGEYRLTLSDGTKVWLNSDSRLRYPVSFQGNIRKVFLEGEAYFEVTKDVNRAFIVSTLKGNIQVLGTSFNVRTYRDEDKVSAVLESGKVKYINNRNREIELLPGYLLEDHGFDLIVSKVNTHLYTGWKDGKYIFDDVSLEEIMSTLERWYDVNVFFKNERLKDLHFTGDLERYVNFNTILGFMEMGGEVKFVVNKNTIIVEKK